MCSWKTRGRAGAARVVPAVQGVWEPPVPQLPEQAGARPAWAALGGRCPCLWGPAGHLGLWVLLFFICWLSGLWGLSSPSRG